MFPTVRAILGLVRRPQIVVAGLSVLLAGGLTNRVEAQTAFQTVHFSVMLPPRNTMTAKSIALNLPSARTAGTATQASVSGSSYAITTNEENQKIAASLSTAMPRGVSLLASLTPPAGAWTNGATTLGGTARDVVGGVSHTNVDALAVEYTLTTRADVSRQTLKTVVTFTITGGV